MPRDRVLRRLGAIAMIEGRAARAIEVLSQSMVQRIGAKGEIRLYRYPYAWRGTAARQSLSMPVARFWFERLTGYRARFTAPVNAV
jgi:hypothetical protein